MSKAPRASLSITILDDEDFRILATSRGGFEAFGVFVSMVVVGRERLQQGQAERVGETDSLRLSNSVAHILARAHLTRPIFDKGLKALAAVAAETGTAPWMHLDESGRLVIRSFFKFNTKTDWGGARPGSGPKPGGHSSRNQDDFKSVQGGFKVIQDEPNGVHLEFQSSSSRIPSYSSSYSVTDSSSPPTPSPGDDDRGSHQECVELALELFGDKVADAVSKSKARLTERLKDSDGVPHWKCFAAALSAADVQRRTPRAKPIEDVFFYVLTVAEKFLFEGIPPAPVAVEPVRAPVRSASPDWVPPNVND